MGERTKVLITGGDGYIGLEVARRYLERTRAPVLLWMRARDAEELERKRQRVRVLLGTAAPRLSFAAGDLWSEEPFRAVDPRGIGTIVHSAAVTRFNVDAATADAVNVEGTRKLLRFAERCPELERVALLSTVYACGLRSGPIPEAPADGDAGFANHYERSKWAAERALLAEHAGLPWDIHRLSTVIAADESGCVSQQNAFHNTLRLLYHGLLSLVPGRPDTPLYFTTGEFAADALFALLQRAPRRRIHHLAHTRAESPTLGGLLDRVFAAFGEQPEFVARRVLRPLYAEPEAFQLLADGVGRLGAGVLQQAVSSVAPFARQLASPKDVRNDQLVAALDDYRAPDMDALVGRVCRHLVRTRWGREVARAA
jgi:nucleoside-diphosphate-sugar epimerase